MRMVCADCGCRFEEEEAGCIYEHIDFWGGGCTEMIMACPKCNSDAIDEEESEEEE